MAQPLLSICIPTYNRIKHIRRLVSFLESELKDVDTRLIEVIISNNHSDDGTFEYLDSLKEKYDWLFISHNKHNIGGFKNMQKLIYMAKGIYLWIPGDDDYLKKGTIGKLLRIIQEESPTYIYMSRRNINEETKEITIQGKKYCIEYNKKIKITHNQLVTLLVDNYTDLKFQTSSVFLTENCKRYDNEANCMDKNAKEACHSLYKTVRSMQEGAAYFISEVLILSGDQTTWSDRCIDYGAVADYKFSNYLLSLGFTKSESREIGNFQLARDLVTCFNSKELMNRWKEYGKPGNGTQLYVAFIVLCLKKIRRKFFKIRYIIDEPIDKSCFGL